MGVGGRARLFLSAKTEDDVSAAVEWARDRSLPLFVIGGGSNVLISDDGFDGLVLSIGLRGIRIVEDRDNFVSIEAAAGEDWDSFVNYCVAENLAGIECLSGIPGLVGGTPVQNVGAYGQEVSETIESVKCYDRLAQQFVVLAKDACGFAYRKSIFNSDHRDRYIVLSVVFKLERHGSPRVVYRDLIEHFTGKAPSLGDVREVVIAIRKAKSMVIDADDPNSRSAGSFFKNPIVTRERFDQMTAELGDIPHFDNGEMVKIPAAWLIETAGFSKGFALGEAGISSNHTLAIINRGNASCDDLLVLMNRIRHGVREKFAIDLVPEPVFVGFA